MAEIRNCGDLDKTKNECKKSIYLFICLPIQQPHKKRIFSHYSKNKQTKQVTSWLVAYWLVHVVQFRSDMSQITPDVDGVILDTLLPGTEQDQLRESKHLEVGSSTELWFLDRKTWEVVEVEIGMKEWSWTCVLQSVGWWTQLVAWVHCK